MGVSLNRVLSVVKSNDGFLQDVDVKLLSSKDPNRKVLIRCGCHRKVVEMKDVQKYIDRVESDGVDYVCDVSLLSDDPIYKEI